MRGREAASEPRTQRSGVSGRPKKPLIPLRCVRGSEMKGMSSAQKDAGDVASRRRQRMDRGIGSG